MSMNAENAFASPDIFFVRYCTNILGAFIFICLLGSLIYASGILDNMRNKEMRISFLMLPATMLEKYVARFLMATLGFIIAAIVGMLWQRLLVIFCFLCLTCLMCFIAPHCLKYFLCLL